jgi:hypothetical protein
LDEVLPLILLAVATFAFVNGLECNLAPKTRWLTFSPPLEEREPLDVPLA